MWFPVVRRQPVVRCEVRNPRVREWACPAARGDREAGLEQDATRIVGIHSQMEARMAARKKDKNLQDLFLDTLRDIYYAEQKILKALPKMARMAQARELKAAFEKHLMETEAHVERLDQVFAMLEQKPKGKKCPAIEGIIKEGDEVGRDYKGSPALDAGLLSAAQAVEHYEITRYGTLRTWAEELGLADAASLIDATLAEEKKTDETLSQMAIASVNMHAEAA